MAASKMAAEEQADFQGTCAHGNYQPPWSCPGRLVKRARTREDPWIAIWNPRLRERGGRGLVPSASWAPKSWAFCVSLPPHPGFWWTLGAPCPCPLCTWLSPLPPFLSSSNTPGCGRRWSVLWPPTSGSARVAPRSRWAHLALPALPRPWTPAPGLTSFFPVSLFCLSL